MIEIAKSLRRKVNTALQPIFFERSVRHIAKKGPISEPLTAFNYMARGNFGVVSAIQSRAELIPMLELVRAQAPQTIMEIGTASGGTLFTLTRVAAPEATIISLDLPGGTFGGGYSEKRIPLYKAFALPGQRLHLLREDSHQPEALKQIKSILQDRTIDFLFIDGDHTYEGVRQDFEMYSPLVTPGGMIGFHDIIYAEGVTKFWGEIRSQFEQVREFIASSEPIYGIGLGTTR